MLYKGDTSKIGKVLVLGGGIAGIQCALDISDLGYYVYLVEKSPSIGGTMAELDKTFPTNDCATCMFSPKMVEVTSRPNVEILTMAEIEDLNGEVGNFRVNVKIMPRYINVEKCITCGICAEKCPRKVLDEFNENLSFRKAAYIPFPQASPRAYVIDAKNCIYLNKGKCGACKKFCPRDAVEFNQETKILELNVGAIVLAPGFDLALYDYPNEMGFGRYKNVISSLQYERILSATGPTSGHIKRPSDGKVPESIAWIQCVLSRNIAMNRPFCSSVCCMHAVKQATLTKIHDPEIQTTIYFMDIRAHGKGFDEFVDRARYQFGVKFKRSMISQLYLNPANENLIIETFDTKLNKKSEKEVELVVLSSGIKPKENFYHLARKIGLVLDRYGFVGSHEFEPVATNIPGIYVCGMAKSPKDIPDTVVESGAAAAEVSVILREERGKEVKKHPEILERETPKEPKIGVFICHCGSNIAGVLGVKELVEYAKGLPHVVVSKDFLFTCSTDTQQQIMDMIQEAGLDRVVVAACSPRTHESLFRETLKKAGLNPYLFEFVNIRDQCSWVHSNAPSWAQKKAKELIAGGIKRVAALDPLKERSFKITKQALVIGGGVAGMVSALTLAEQGFDVHLLEKTQALGGIAKDIVETLKGQSPLNLVRSLSHQVMAHPKIKVHLNANLTNHKGHVGAFEGEVSVNGEKYSISYGVVIVATGGMEYRPTEYLYGTDPRIMTQMELQNKLWNDPQWAKTLDTVAMIQCVGSRNDSFPSCSRVCCATALKTSLRLKDLNPEMQIIVLYRDLRSFGMNELYYLKARTKGILFFRYIPENPPQLLKKRDLELRFLDRSSRQHYLVKPDLVVLSAGIRPNPDALAVAELLKLPRLNTGFFQEAHIKLRPVEFALPGIYLAGLAHSPRFVEECVTMAKAAATHAAKVLCQDQMTTPATVAVVDPTKCAACLICVRTCPFGAPFINQEGVSEIRPSQCMGCGNCVSECPAKAIELLHWTDKQLNEQIDGILEWS
jgi:heterodisulfide reductase subunit A